MTSLQIFLAVLALLVSVLSCVAAWLRLVADRRLQDPPPAPVPVIVTPPPVRRAPARRMTPRRPPEPPAGPEVPVVTERPVPHFLLDATPEPPDGGRVQGAGEYASGKTVALYASPAEGWRFDGWAGDLRDGPNPASVGMDAPKNVIARFSRVRPGEWTLTGRADPPEGGEVRGGGRYVQGVGADVEALAAPGWRFTGWRGDVGGKATSASLTMSGDSTAVAVFQRVADSVFTVRAEPPEGGSVLGGGPHPFGANVTVRAIPSPLWRFSHWGDGGAGTRGHLSLRAEGDRSFVAYFERTIWEEGDVHPAPQEAVQQNALEAAPTLGGAFQSQADAAPSVAGPEEETAPGVAAPRWARLGDAAGVEQSDAETAVPPAPAAKPTVGKAFLRGSGEAEGRGGD